MFKKVQGTVSGKGALFRFLKAFVDYEGHLDSYELQKKKKRNS